MYVGVDGVAPTITRNGKLYRRIPYLWGLNKLTVKRDLMMSPFASSKTIIAEKPFINRLGDKDKAWFVYVYED